MSFNTTSPTFVPTSATIAPTKLSYGASLGIELAYFVILAIFCCCSGSATWLFARIFTSNEPEDRRRALALMNMADNMGFRNMTLNDEHLLRIGEFKFDENTKLPLEGEDPSECPICLAEFRKGEVCRTMPEPCQHTFHKICIDEWFQQSSRCPLCKRSIFSILEEEQQHTPDQSNNVNSADELMTQL